MPAPITPVGNLIPAEAIRITADSRPGGDFQKLLQGAINGIERPRQEAAQAVEKFLTGENEEVHTTVLAAQKAELALELGLQVRNKVVQAYQEIMRMPM